MFNRLLYLKALVGSPSFLDLPPLGVVSFLFSFCFLLFDLLIVLINYIIYHVSGEWEGGVIVWEGFGGRVNGV